MGLLVCFAKDARLMPYKDKAEKVANGKAYYLANKERITARNKAYRLIHLDHLQAKHSEWEKQNRVQCNLNKARYKALNPDKTLAQARKERFVMTDGYIRKKISQVYEIKGCDIPQSLVDVHRELLKLKRAIRNEKC